MRYRAIEVDEFELSHARQYVLFDRIYWPKMQDYVEESVFSEEPLLEYECYRYYGVDDDNRSYIYISEGWRKAVDQQNN